MSTWMHKGSEYQYHRFVMRYEPKVSSNMVGRWEILELNGSIYIIQYIYSIFIYGKNIIIELNIAGG